MSILEGLTEEECYLYAIFSDRSGLDLAEFSLVDLENDDACFRAWPFQWKWWRDDSPRQIDCASRSVGKSLSIKLRAYAFPFNYPNQEMVITAPEGVHLDAITDVVETAFMNNKLARYMLAADRSKFKHRPFHCVGEDQLVMTKRGYVPIQDVEIGDEVWTHEARWRQVLEVHDNGYQDVVSVQGRGHHGLVVTEDHEFWTSRIKQTPIIGSSGKRVMKWVRREPEWRKVRDFRLKEPNERWCSAAKFDDIELTETSFRLNKQGFGVGNGAKIDVLTDDFMWFLGHYMAEGCVWGKNLVAAAIHEDEVDYVIKRYQDVGFDVYTEIPCFETKGRNLKITNAVLASWLRENLPGKSHEKQIPPWVFSLSPELRQAFLDGYTYGDGHWIGQRCVAVTVSRSLAYGLKTLALSLGATVSIHHQPDPKPSIYKGKTIQSKPTYSVSMNFSKDMKHIGFSWDEEGFAWSAVRKITPLNEKSRVYDLTVEEDHSYTVEGVLVHNCNFNNGARIMGRIPQHDGKGIKGSHPVVLEQDEASDYPTPGWMEIIETLKMGSENSTWRAHGVTRGVRDHFYKFTQPDSGWKVHRIVAMARPTWSDEERQAKIELYGSRDHPDYRRNVLGDHGDSENVLFVLSRLMATVDQNEDSDYNSKLYTSIKITPEKIAEVGGVLNLLDIPRTHMEYEKFWIGMDVGYINDPSEIVVFGEETVGKKRTLRLLSRFSLQRVAHQDQVEAILWVLETYKPQAFACDKTGLGLPLYQAILHETQKHPVLKRQTDKIKGFGFSEKILAEIDTSIEVDPHMGDLIKEAGIHRNVLEWSTDILRGMVDKGTVVLPYDLSVIQQFQGQTYHYSKASQDMYGRRRIFSQGTFHVLDACRMAVLGWQQADLAPMLVQEKKQIARPMFMFG